MSQSEQLGMWWTPEGHLTLSPESLGKANRDRLSASTANSMNSCPARTAADKALPRQFDPFGPAPLGTNAHSVLEAMFNLPAEKRTREMARTITTQVADETIESAVVEAQEMRDHGFDVTNPFEGDEEHQRRTRLTLISEIWKRTIGLWHMEDPQKVNVFRNEWPINIPVKKGEKVKPENVLVEIAGTPFTGFIDRTELDDNGNMIVGDYKAGKVGKVYSPDEKGDQLRLYLAAVEKLTGKRPVGAKLLFTRHGVVRHVDTSESEMSGTFERFNKGWRRLRYSVDANEFEAKPSPLCPWCPVVASCPKGQRSRWSRPVAADGTIIKLDTLRRGGSDQSEDGVLQIVSPSLHTGGNPGRESHESGRRKEDTMSESKPWEKWINLPNGGREINPNSYAMTASASGVSHAFQIIDASEFPVTSPAMDSIAMLALSICDTVQNKVFGATDRQHGSHVRIRGFYFAFCDQRKPPIGSTSADEWRAWYNQAVNVVTRMTRSALSLAENEEGFDLDAAIATLVDHGTKNQPKAAPRGAVAKKAAAAKKAPAYPLWKIADA
jgi:putative RecB family exonuclease